VFESEWAALATQNHVPFLALVVYLYHGRKSEKLDQQIEQ
jgi:hypothetical protein